MLWCTRSYQYIAVKQHWTLSVLWRMTPGNTALMLAPCDATWPAHKIRAVESPLGRRPVERNRTRRFSLAVKIKIARKLMKLLLSETEPAKWSWNCSEEWHIEVSLHTIQHRNFCQKPNLLHEVKIVPKSDTISKFHWIHKVDFW